MCWHMRRQTELNGRTERKGQARHTRRHHSLREAVELVLSASAPARGRSALPPSACARAACPSHVPRAHRQSAASAQGGSGARALTARSPSGRRSASAVTAPVPRPGRDAPARQRTPDCLTYCHRTLPKSHTIHAAAAAAAVDAGPSGSGQPSCVCRRAVGPVCATSAAASRAHTHRTHISLVDVFASTHDAATRRPRAPPTRMQVCKPTVATAKSAYCWAKRLA